MLLVADQGDNGVGRDALNDSSRRQRERPAQQEGVGKSAVVGVEPEQGVQPAPGQPRDDLE